MKKQPSRITLWILCKLLYVYPILFVALWCEKNLSGIIEYGAINEYHNHQSLNFSLSYDIEQKEIYNDVIEFLKQKEGFRENRYVCAGGKVTIGYGFTDAGIEEAKRYGFLDKDFVLPKKMSKKEAEDFLENVMIPTFGAMVDEYVGRKLKDSQRLALVSFAYNVGRSPLKKVSEDINNGKEPVDRMVKYVYAKKKKLAGLVSRREKEIELWNMSNL